MARKTTPPPKTTKWKVPVAPATRGVANRKIRQDANLRGLPKGKASKGKSATRTAAEKNILFPR